MDKGILISLSYINAKFKLHEVTLIVNYVRYLYTTQNVAESLEETLVEWNLHKKLFTVTTDNTVNMKKTILDMNKVKWQACNAHTL